MCNPILLVYANNKAKARGHLTRQRHGTNGKQFSFFKSYYVDDTAFLFLAVQSSDLDKAAKPIVSHFRRFGLTIHIESFKGKRVFENKVYALFYCS
jgi:hypothetical protein